MATKIDHVNGAYTHLRISGITVNPSGSDVELGLKLLENMMAQLQDSSNLCLGYNFEETPEGTTESGVKRSHHDMIESNLAVNLAPAFNKAIPQTLFSLASSSFSASSSQLAADKARQVLPPERMPRGSGNRFNRFNRYNYTADQAPNDCDTNKMQDGGVNDYSETFTAYLDGETISSFTITSDDLTIVSSSNTDNVVSYRIQATKSGYQTVVITITTDSGRIEARTIDFEVS